MTNSIVTAYLKVTAVFYSRNTISNVTCTYVWFTVFVSQDRPITYIASPFIVYIIIMKAINVLYYILCN